MSLSPGIKDLPTISQVTSAVEKALKKPRSLDFLTFSGNGEPSIHPDFPAIVCSVKEIVSRLRPNAKLALLSNSSRVMVPEILSAICLFDAPMMKLDAGDEDTFFALNQPAENIRFADIIDGLKEIPNLIIQSIMIDGAISNIRGAAHRAWIDTLLEIKPREVHIYSSERPTADETVVCVSPAKLKVIEEDLNSRFGLNVTAYWFENF
ncbi:MAG: hypothetical protein RQ728_10020 [Brevefilum sp.]|nr:hypothetical protein [Brevefilum sp.]